MELSQGWSGKLVEQGSEERPVRRGEPWFIDSALEEASWWRSARISMSLSALLIDSNRRSVTMPVRAR